MLELSEITIDPQMADNGVWTDILGARFLLARPGAAYRDYISTLYRENYQLVGTLEGLKTAEGQAKSQEIMQRAYAMHIVKDWEGITNKGEALEYSEESAYRLISDPRYRELHEALDMFVFSRSNFRGEADEEIAEQVKPTADS